MQSLIHACKLIVSKYFVIVTHCALASCGAVYCNRSCLWVCVCVCECVYLFVCLWVCYHDNWKLRASILTKLGLLVKVVTISSWLHFGRPRPREGVCGGAKIVGSALLHPARSVCVSLSAFFILFTLAFAKSVASLLSRRKVQVLFDSVIRKTVRCYMI